MPHVMAHPMRYVLDPSAIGTPDAEKAKAACKYDAVELNMEQETIEMTVAYGGTAKEAGLDGHIIQPKKLQELATKK